MSAAPRSSGAAPRASGEASAGDEARPRRKLIEGVVVSDKGSKTRVVVVERRVRHAFYGKVMSRRARFYVHDEGEQSHAGDVVEIMSCRPMSRLKRWRLVRVVKTLPAGRGAPRQGEARPMEVPAAGGAAAPPGEVRNAGGAA